MVDSIMINFKGNKVATSDGQMSVYALVQTGGTFSIVFWKAFSFES